MKTPSQTEFIAMMAMLFATIALSIDAMLPALPAIAADLSPQDSSKALLVVSSFFFGMGFGTFVAGPVSDAFGRKPVIFACAAIYAAATVLCFLAPSLEMLPDALIFPAHVLWSIGVFAMMGLAQGNLNALAMEDLGQIAGFAASMITATSTVLASLLAVPVGLAFEGTQIPLMVGVAAFSSLALALILTVRTRPA